MPFCSLLRLNPQTPEPPGQIRLPDGAPYDTTKDHSKWAVHAQRPLTLVGDINRMQS